MRRLPALAARLSLLAAALLVSGGCLGPLGAGPTATPEPSPTASPTATSLPTATPTVTPAPTVTPSPRPAPSPSPSRTPSPTATPVPTATAPPSSGQRALQHVRYLAETVGSRPAGSAQERAAADYIEAQLRSYGYSVQRQSFPFPYFVDRGSQLRVLGPPGEELHPLTLGLSAPGRVEGRLVNVGLAQSQDLPREGLQGRIALIQRGETTFDQKVSNVSNAGALAAIIYNNAPGNFRGRLGQIASMPVVSISQEEGRRLLDLLAAGPVSARLSVEATSEERTSVNVIAGKPGSRPDTVVFGAHYDSVEAGPGANDNASGTAALLELARLSPSGPLTLRFVAFGAEELGLLGSRYYVSTLSPQERQQTVAMVSLDMVGVGDRMRFGGTASLVERGLAIAGEQGIQAQALEGSSAGASDHSSFISAGIPGVLFHYTVGNDLDPRYHTAEDRASFVEEADLGRTIGVALALAARLGEGR